MRRQWDGFHHHPGAQGQRSDNRRDLGAAARLPEAERAKYARLSRERPQPHQAPLGGQFACTLSFARQGVVYLQRRRSRRRRDRHGDQELAAREPDRNGPCWPRIIRMDREPQGLVAAPDPQRHGGQYLLQAAVVRGREQTQRPPLARLQRRTPQAQQLAGAGQLGGTPGFAGADVVDRRFRRSRGDAGGHRHKIFHRAFLGSSGASGALSDRR
jgi:hypothetical protein